MKVSSKIILASVLLSGMGILIAGALVSWQASSVAAKAMEKSAFDQLVAVRELQKTQIENYFLTISRQIKTLSNNTMVIDAMRDLPELFFKFDQQSSLRDNDALARYYTGGFDPEYQRKNPGTDVSSIGKFRQLDQNSKSLQHAYISANSHALGNKNALEMADDGSEYSLLHGKYHKHFNHFLDEFGYYDIFLVEPENGYIVYSVFKELDFATSLTYGPYKDTGIAQAYALANKSTAKTSGVLVDFKPYFPSYDAAAAFIGAAIFAPDGKKLGVLIFQMPIDRINDLMTYQQGWHDVGLGDSGETYLVGDDRLLRSQSRFLMEDKVNYLAALKKAGFDETVLKKINASDSAIGLQAVDTEGASAAIAGKTGIKSIKDYRGVEVLSAFAPLDIPGVKWGILSEIDVAEAMADKDKLTALIWWLMMMIMLLLLPVISAAAYMVGRGISNPIQSFIAQVNSVTAEKDLTTRVSYRGKDELSSLADSFNHLLTGIQEILHCVENLAKTLYQSTNKMLKGMDETTGQTGHQCQNADSVAVATNELLSTIQEVARSATAAAETVRETDGKCQDTSHAAGLLTGYMDDLNQQMVSASTSIEKLAQESQSIGSVLDVIQSIAEQTNLLALNAAIEAARAGEQGRGFAVVADEVRTLASRTQQSTEDIRNKINALQSETSTAVKMVAASGKMANASISACNDNRETLGQVVELVARLNDMNAQIATAAEQQTTVVNDINQNITEIAGTSQQISEKADANKGDVKKISILVTNLEDKMREFKL
ncbi:methyl-accepting chemotaxis protein [Thalassomonas actiniarum]|uniref:Methyl-accepting chemotaxis protein n=2 Tax=Thalassomonas actiniarum TaxID=485447 RepID=A0AAF0C5W3_9GAMM|nr:methyl-accepting chemotaxis protein [Thalassomonas actiniarum]